MYSPLTQFNLSVSKLLMVLNLALNAIICKVSHVQILC